MKMYNEIRDVLLKLYSEGEVSEEIKLKKYNEYLNSIRKLAYNGNAEAQYDLAQHYEDVNFLGSPNPYFNKFKRLYWYNKAAKNNHASSYNNLADLFERGDGCEIDLNKALSYYKKSMELGDYLGKINYKKMFKDLNKGGIYDSNF